MASGIIEHQMKLIDAEIALLEQIDDRQQREHLHQDFGYERARVFAGIPILEFRMPTLTPTLAPTPTPAPRRRSSK